VFLSVGKVYEAATAARSLTVGPGCWPARSASPTASRLRPVPATRAPTR